MTIPDYIINHILKKLPPYAGLTIFHTDSTGILSSCYGPWDRYFDSSPEKGLDLTLTIPYLTGLLPIKTDTLELQNLQLKENFWIDIHILKDHDGSHWVFMSDRSKEALKLQKLLQKVNEKSLRFGSQSLEELEKNPFGQIHLFQVAGFEKEKNGTYQAIGKAPKWLSVLKPGICKKDKKVNLIEEFPFLEIFELELKEITASSPKNYFNSGIWIETDGSGKEYFLRAFATYYHDKEYLLIRFLNEDLMGEQETMQKAREHQLAYENLAKAQKKLKEILDYKDKFVSIITHDLRSPIASVLGATEMLSNDTRLVGKIDDFSKEMLFAMRDEMSRLLDYNDKLYHWSNLELGNFELVEETIGINKLAKMIEQTFKQRLEEKKIHFSSTLPLGLKIKVDITLFLQALNNLVSNAIKFTPEGGSLNLSAEQTGDHLKITVSDSGVGMNEEKAAHLFDSSYSNSTQGTQGEKGSGLGLGIVKRIMEAHGFSIRALSKTGKGTQIIIEI